MKKLGNMKLLPAKISKFISKKISQWCNEIKNLGIDHQWLLKPLGHLIIEGSDWWSDQS